MTSIGGQQRFIPMTGSLPSPDLGIGQKLQVSVLGPARQGVSVAIGRETFVLEMSSRLSKTSILTLEILDAASASGQRVQILENDNQPLPNPIIGHLFRSSETLSPSESVRVERNHIQVNALPINLDGMVVGQKVILELQIVKEVLLADAKSRQSTQTLENFPSLNLTCPPNTSKLFNQGPGFVAIEQGHSKRGMMDNFGQGSQTTKAMLAEGTESEIRGPQKALTLTASADELPIQGLISAQSERTTQGRSQAAISFASSSMAIPVHKRSVDSNISGREDLSAAGKMPYQTHGTNSLQLPFREHERTLATVIERTENDSVILKAADQFMRVEQPVDLPIGTTLQVTFVSVGSINASRSDSTVADTSSTLLTKLINLLNDIDKQGRMLVNFDRSAPTQQMSTSNKHIASRLLDFITTASNRQKFDLGDASFLPSSSTDRVVLKDEVYSLVRELGGRASELLDDGWRSLILPIDSDQGQTASLYYRDQNVDSDEETIDDDPSRDRSERAIFDVTFSQLGRCQIDAFCQKLQFDLMIRSEASFQDEERQYIALMFETACEISGMIGEIGFIVGDFFEPPRIPVAGENLRASI